MIKLNADREAKLWVTDPVSGVDVNVAPLFIYLHDLEGKPNLPLAAGARTTIERVLKVLNLTAHDPRVTESTDLVNLYMNLHLLKDMFSALEERPANKEE